MFIGFVTERGADFVQNFIPMSEVWMNVGTEGGSSGTLAKKNSRIDYPTLYFFGEKI